MREACLELYGRSPPSLEMHNAPPSKEPESGAPYAECWRAKRKPEGAHYQPLLNECDSVDTECTECCETAEEASTSEQ